MTDTPITDEAASPDRWTNRARPAFLYVMYLVILAALPLGVIAGIAPRTAAEIVGGIRAYLAAIPEPLWALFGTGYLGYSAMRSFDKARGVG